MTGSIRLYLALLFACLCTTCKKEQAALSPTPKDSLFYPLPQGNQAYDRQIMQWYRTYGTYVLYRYSKKDYQYGFTGIYPDAIIVQTADTTALPAAVDFLQRYWFDDYPVDFLRKFLPFKILLAGTIMASSDGADTTDTPITSPFYGLDYIVVPQIDARFPKLSASRKQALRTALHITFLQSLFFSVDGFTPPKLTPPPAFFDISRYQETNLTPANKYQYGYLYLDKDNGQWTAPVKDMDFMYFLYTVVSTPGPVLEATLLSPHTDKNGLIRKKYACLLAYFKNQFHIDLQQIGNQSA
ncbi:hypothetical protein [Chitinophaga nivalis]|uniref:Uncharacterized protein n=1 Tax=Chitinophaga nivalis TaxID=2991709 RepID=A0ABT3IGC0_9BACT|nr:hypothetical protein [Chitinophaga nivalis]MCW3467291.1 hypothetical protein [Chitinophaga nivalis]MCW3483017.1 hypothetical protein [Chitinophaga nivalis]